jgi:predicted HicB family RNase H-like nuclease
MPLSEAKSKANKKYREKFEFLQTRLPAEEKAIVIAHAETMGESLNAFVRRAIAEAIERDRKEKQE